MNYIAEHRVCIYMKGLVGYYRGDEHPALVARYYCAYNI